MALVACKQCNRRVAENAHSCPHCGAPVAWADELSLSQLLKSFRKFSTTNTNLPIFLGAGLGVALVFGAHLLLGGPTLQVNSFTLAWQVALAAVVGSLLGALLKKV